VLDVCVRFAAVALATVTNRFGVAELQSEQRLWYFPFLLGLFRAHPLLGVGYGKLSALSGVRVWVERHCRCVRSVLAGAGRNRHRGFCALVALVWAVIVSLVRALRVDGPWRPYLVGWLGTVVSLMVPYLFFGDRFSLYVWVVLGLAASTARLAQRGLIAT